MDTEIDKWDSLDIIKPARDLPENSYWNLDEYEINSWTDFFDYMYDFDFTTVENLDCFMDELAVKLRSNSP